MNLPKCNPTILRATLQQIINLLAFLPPIAAVIIAIVCPGNFRIALNT